MGWILRIALSHHSVPKAAAFGGDLLLLTAYPE
jgi:hypothetical protein